MRRLILGLKKVDFYLSHSITPFVVPLVGKLVKMEVKLDV